MSIYWERCDLCGQFRPTKKCSTIPDTFVDIHCCITCPYRGSKCKNPVWKVEGFTLVEPGQKRLSSEEREAILKELLSLLKSESS